MSDGPAVGDGQVWIYCPANRVTGGPEALHQLARALTDLGVDARLVYYPESGTPYSVPGEYREYAPRIATHGADEPGDVVVVPEVATRRLRAIRRARRIVWWLSIDNYLVKRSMLGLLRGLAYRDTPLRISELNGCGHCAQSAYAADFLRRKGIAAALLTDYLRPVHHSDDGPDAGGDRGRVVLFNPKKAGGFTRRVMRLTASQCDWVGLEAMSPEQVAAAMRRARLYVDFGPHPGRDRMPREAAVHGCCVLTGRRGAAAYEADLPIPEWYKVDERVRDADVLAAGKIAAILSDYVHHHARLAAYRAWIARQRDEFTRQVRAVFLKS